jgi:hypothetical protein
MNEPKRSFQNSKKLSASPPPKIFTTVPSTPLRTVHRPSRLHEEQRTLPPTPNNAQRRPSSCPHRLLRRCLIRNSKVTQYRNHIIHDPTVYLTRDKKQLRVGSKIDAEKDKWVSLVEERKNYESDEVFAKKISGITMLTT